MLNKEVVQGFFVKEPLHNSQGKICPLPLGGGFMAEGLRNSWLKQKLPKEEIPLVSVGPTKLDDGTEGYSIRKEIVHK